MNLQEHLRRILELLETSASKEIGESYQTILERINEPSVSPEDHQAAVSGLIQTQEHTLEQLYDALQHIESEQLNLTNEILSNPEAKTAIQALLREVSRLAQNRSDAIKELSQRSRILLLDARANDPNHGFFPAAVQTLGTAVPNWAKKYKSLSKRINKLEIYFALKLGFEELEQRQKRQSSLEEIKDLGVDPYPHKFERTHTVTQIAQEFESTLSHELEEGRSHVKVAGRIQAINNMGKTGFIRITDGTTFFQIYLKSSEVNPQTWSLFRLLDLGDLIGTEGSLFRTNTGEPSIKAKSITFLAKSLVPPPDKYYGLHDIELRYRRRYADLIANREVRRVFETRSQVIRLIRRYFDERGYIEVETPMLTSLPTGAAARPFRTHHNVLNIDLYARIAPELYLKRLIVGGFEKVYEINRNFRNEGIDRSHNPEFTMLEWYEAYSEYEDLIRTTEELISMLEAQVPAPDQRIFKPEALGRRILKYGEDEIDFTRPWQRFTMREAIGHFWEEGRPRRIRGDELATKEELLHWVEESSRQELKSHLPHLRSLDYGHLLGELFEHVVEPLLINPTFITEFPTELSPLSKQNQDDPRFVDRFELFIAGMEIANGFCEINDPVDQRQRFEAQTKLRERGDEEAMVVDEDYIRALSYGMPPTAGEGVGIDRLVMLLTNSRSIRDVILFPHMRPEKPVAGCRLPVAGDAEEPVPGDSKQGTTTDH